MQHVFLALVCVLMCKSAAFAQTTRQEAQAQLRIASLAATCASCHGPQGDGAVPNSIVPSLNLFSADYIKTNLMWFKTGQRPSTVMGHIAKGYTDEQIEQIANHFGKKN